MVPNFIGRLFHKIAFVAPGGYSMRPWLHKARGSRIGKNVWISQLVYIDDLYPEAVTIGDNSIIGLRTTIYAHIHWGQRQTGEIGEVVIGKDVFIGPHCLILPNVHIGDGSVIKGGTVVTKDIPHHTFFGSPPAIPLGVVTVPLAPPHDYKEFIRGLRPVRTGKRTK
jgi:heptaprenylglycerol acetyltransferase